MHEMRQAFITMTMTMSHHNSGTRCKRPKLEPSLASMANDNEESLLEY